MEIKKGSFFKYCVVILAVLNLVWLFGFEYRIPNLKGKQAPKTEEAGAAASTAVATVADKKEPDDKSKEEKEPEEEVTYCRVIVSPKLNVREGPGTNYDILTTASYNEILTVYGAEKGWVHIRNEEGIEGYVSETYVEMLDEKPE